MLMNSCVENSISHACTHTHIHTLVFTLCPQTKSSWQQAITSSQQPTSISDDVIYSLSFTHLHTHTKRNFKTNLTLHDPETRLSIYLVRICIMPLPPLPTRVIYDVCPHHTDTHRNWCTCEQSCMYSDRNLDLCASEKQFICHLKPLYEPINTHCVFLLVHLFWIFLQELHVGIFYSVVK